MLDENYLEVILIIIQKNKIISHPYTYYIYTKNEKYIIGFRFALRI